MCKGEKSCDCGCKDQYNLDLGIPLTFGEGGYISKKLVQDLDQRLIKQFPNDFQARQAMRDQAMGVIRQMAYGGLTNKGSGSQALNYNPNSSVSNNLYDQGFSTSPVDTSILEGTRKEKIKNFARTGAQTTIGTLTGVVDAAGSMAGIDTEPLTGKLSNLKFGEMTQSDLEKQQRANQIGQTVGAAAATVAAGVATGGNPTLISRGASQTFEELGQIDPNSSTLKTISGAGQVGSQLYGAGASAGTTGGFSPEQLESGAGMFNPKQTQDLSKYLQATQGMSGATSLANGGPTDPPVRSTSPNLDALAAASTENNYYGDIDFGRAGAYSNAEVENAIRYYFENGKTKFAVNTGQDKKGNPYYTTTDLAGLAGTVNSIEEENFKLAASGNTLGPVSYNKGNAELNLSPAARRSVGKESYFDPSIGDAGDIGSEGALIGRMNPLDAVDLKKLKMQPINTVKVGPTFPGSPRDCTPDGGGRVPRSCRLEPKSWANGGFTDPPTTGKKLPTLYVDPNSPAGQARYQAYQDSSLIYNNTVGGLEDIRNARSFEGLKNLRPEGFNTAGQNFKDHIAALQRLNNPEPRETFRRDLPEGIAGLRSVGMHEYYEPVQPVKYGVGALNPVPPTLPSSLKPSPERNLSSINIPRGRRFDNQPHYTTDNKGNKILSEMNIWDEQAKSWKRRKPTSEEMQYFTPQMRKLDKVSFQNGGPTDPLKKKN